MLRTASAGRRLRGRELRMYLGGWIQGHRVRCGPVVRRVWVLLMDGHCCQCQSLRFGLQVELRSGVVRAGIQAGCHLRLLCLLNALANVSAALD